MPGNKNKPNAFRRIKRRMKSFLKKEAYEYYLLRRIVENKHPEISEKHGKTICKLFVYYHFYANPYDIVCGYSLTHCAVERGIERAIEILISYKADINILDNRGQPAIYYAIQSGQSNIARLLIKKGSIVRSAELFGAVRMGNIHLTKEILDKGINIHSIDKYGETPLHLATKLLSSSPEEMIPLYNMMSRFLLTNGANKYCPSKFGVMPIHYAAISGLKSILDIFLTEEDDINLTDYNGKTALMMAAERGLPNAVALLIKHGADINKTCNDGKTANEYAIYKYQLHKNSLIPTRFWAQDNYNIGYELNIFEKKIIYAAILQMFASQIVKMLSARRFLTQEGIHTCYPYRLYTFVYHCAFELRRMSEQKFISTRISFYDFLTKDLTQLARYLKIKSVSETLKTSNFEELFPIYYDMLLINLKKAQKRLPFLDYFQKSFMKISEGVKVPPLPENCNECITSFLSNKEIQNLEVACLAKPKKDKKNIKKSSGSKVLVTSDEIAKLECVEIPNGQIFLKTEKRNKFEFDDDEIHVTKVIVEAQVHTNEPNKGAKKIKVAKNNNQSATFPANRGDMKITQLIVRSQVYIDDIPIAYQPRQGLDSEFVSHTQVQSAGDICQAEVHHQDPAEQAIDGISGVFRAMQRTQIDNRGQLSELLDQIQQDDKIEDTSGLVPNSDNTIEVVPDSKIPEGTIQNVLDRAQVQTDVANRNNGVQVVVDTVEVQQSDEICQDQAHDLSVSDSALVQADETDIGNHPTQVSQMDASKVSISEFVGPIEVQQIDAAEEISSVSRDVQRTQIDNRGQLSELLDQVQQDDNSKEASGLVPTDKIFEVFPNSKIPEATIQNALDRAQVQTAVASRNNGVQVQAVVDAVKVQQSDDICPDQANDLNCSDSGRVQADETDIGSHPRQSSQMDESEVWIREFFGHTKVQHAGDRAMQLTEINNMGQLTELLDQVQQDDKFPVPDTIIEVCQDSKIPKGTVVDRDNEVQVDVGAVKVQVKEGEETDKTRQVYDIVNDESNGLAQAQDSANKTLDSNATQVIIEETPVAFRAMQGTQMIDNSSELVGHFQIEEQAAAAQQADDFEEANATGQAHGPDDGERIPRAEALEFFDNVSAVKTFYETAFAIYDSMLARQNTQAENGVQQIAIEETQNAGETSQVLQDQNDPTQGSDESVGMYGRPIGPDPFDVHVAKEIREFKLFYERAGKVLERLVYQNFPPEILTEINRQTGSSVGLRQVLMNDINGLRNGVCSIFWITFFYVLIFLRVVVRFFRANREFIRLLKYLIRPVIALRLIFMAYQAIGRYYRFYED